MIATVMPALPTTAMRDRFNDEVRQFTSTGVGHPTEVVPTEPTTEPDAGSSACYAMAQSWHAEAA